MGHPDTDSNDNVYVAGNSNRTFYIATQKSRTSDPPVFSLSNMTPKANWSGQVNRLTLLGLARGLATDPEDNIIVAGFYRATIDIDGTSLAHMGNEDILLAKYSSSGNLKWLSDLAQKGKNGPNKSSPMPVVTSI